MFKVIIKDTNGVANFEHVIGGWEGLCERWRNFGRVENNVPHFNFQTPWTHWLHNVCKVTSEFMFT